MKRNIMVTIIAIMLMGLLTSVTFANNEAFVSFRINDAVLQDHIPIEDFSNYKVYVNGVYLNTFDNRFRFDYGMATVGQVLHIKIEMPGYTKYEGDYTVKADPGTGLENDFIIYLKALGQSAQSVESVDTTQSYITKTVDETTQGIVAETLGVAIDLPNHVVDEPTLLTITPIENSHNNGIPESVIYKKVIDISLGDIHHLTGFARITMAYDVSQIPSGVKAEEYVSARYLDEVSNQWQEIYYEVNPDKNEIYIKTDHFSQFALLMGDRHNARVETTAMPNPEAFVTETQNESDIVTALKALDAGLKNISDYKLVESTEFIIGTDSLTPLKDGLKYYGKGKKIFAIHQGIWASGKETPEAKKAVLDAAKAVFDYGMDELISLPSAASVGVAIIDYALTEFTDAAFEGNEKVYYTAYTDFYNTAKGPGVKSIKEWIELIESMIDPQNPQDLSRKLDEYVADYLNIIWDGDDNEGWFDDQVHAYGKNFAYQSLLTPAMKVKMADQFKPILYDTRILPALTQIREKEMEAAEQALDDKYWELEMYLTLPNGIRVDFQTPQAQEGTYALDQVKISLLDANHNVIKNQPQDIKFRNNAKEVRFTLMELLERKVNIKFVKVEIPLHDGSYRTEMIEVPFNPFEEAFGEVSVNLPENYIEFEEATEEINEAVSEIENTKEVYKINLVFRDVKTRAQILSDIHLSINGLEHKVYNGQMIFEMLEDDQKGYTFEFSAEGYETNTLSLNFRTLKNHHNQSYDMYLKAVETEAITQEDEEALVAQSESALYHNIGISVRMRGNVVSPYQYPKSVDVTLNGVLYPGLELDQYGKAILQIPRTPGPFHNDPVVLEVRLSGAEPASKTRETSTAYMTNGYHPTTGTSAYWSQFDFYVPDAN